MQGTKYLAGITASLAYGSGFIVATAALHIVGIAAGLMLQRRVMSGWIRRTGMAASRDCQTPRCPRRFHSSSTSVALQSVAGAPAGRSENGARAFV